MLNTPDKLIYISVEVCTSVSEWHPTQHMGVFKVYNFRIGDDGVSPLLRRYMTSYKVLQNYIFIISIKSYR